MSRITNHPEPEERQPEPEWVPPWKRPGFKPSRPEDPCPECGKTIREHIEEFKRAGERIVARVVRL